MKDFLKNLPVPATRSEETVQSVEKPDRKTAPRGTGSGPMTSTKDQTMTSFLNPELAADKASRKKRQQRPAGRDTAATERAMATLRRSLEKQTKKEDNQERLRAKAIADTMPDFIAALDEDALAPFFFALERLATAANGRRIATHPLRPEIVDEMHADADEDEVAEKLQQAAAEQRQQKRKAEQSGGDKATPGAGAAGE